MFVHQLELGPRVWTVEGDPCGVEAFLSRGEVYRWQLRTTEKRSSTAGTITFREVESQGSTPQLEILTKMGDETGATLTVAPPSQSTQAEFSISSFQAIESAWRVSGLFPLHAAALVTPRGRGILFVGASGTGKTTLTIRLAGEGWRYLSDDGVGVETGPFGVMAWGLRRIFMVVEEDLDPRFQGSRRWPDSSGPAGPDQAPKHAVFGDVMFPNAFVPSARPSAIVFLGPDDSSGLEAPPLRPLPRSRALARLVETATWPTDQPRLSERQLDALRDLAAQCDHFSLDYRAHPKHDALSEALAAL